MSNAFHKLYILAMVAIVILVSAFIGLYGFDYYATPIDQRFYHAQYDWFKPSGIFGHGLGIMGTLMILFGVVFYIVSKKYRLLEGVIRLKYLLEFHIFLCTLGPILILFHTSFKFGGVVSVAFWSMVAVVASGVVGRFIYIQIPRSIEGRELTLQEVKSQQETFSEQLNDFPLSHELLNQVGADEKALLTFGPTAFFRRRQALRIFQKQLRADGVLGSQQKAIINLIKQQWTLKRKMVHMEQMQKLFKHWHIAHKPFALIMLVIVVLHVIVTVALGYTWIW